MAIDKELKGQIKKNLLEEKKERHYDEPCISGRRKLYLSLSEAENGYTVHANDSEYVATDVEEVVEIITTLLEAHEEIKDE